MAVLGNEDLLRIHGAAMEAGLGWKRTELLAGLPPAFAQDLSPVPSSSPAAHILADLHAINHVERLVDGSVPLVAWLLRAEELAAPGASADVFRAMRERIVESEARGAKT